MSLLGQNGNDDDEADAEFQAEVICSIVMEDSKRIIRQEQIDEDPQTWGVYNPTEKVFLKLHHGECHVFDCVEKFGMIGRFWEEGFEATHPKARQEGGQH